jgi:hypothetical protein
MKAPREPQRRILFASLPALLLVGLVLPVFSAADSAPLARNELYVFPRQGGCGVAALNSPQLAQVRLALASQLVLPSGGSATTDMVRAVLLAEYGSRVTESVTPMGYVKVWNPVLETWEWVCLSASQFEIDFGSEGAIVVDSRDTRAVEG